MRRGFPLGAYGGGGFHIHSLQLHRQTMYSDTPPQGTRPLPSRHPAAALLRRCLLAGFEAAVLFVLSPTWIGRTSRVARIDMKPSRWSVTRQQTNRRQRLLDRHQNLPKWLRSRFPGRERLEARWLDSPPAF